MRFIGLQRYTIATLLTLAFAAIPAQATAEQAVSARECEFEVQVCQVLTNITGAGLTSQTLRGMNGWFQIVHQRLDDTELVMEGSTLTWNGKSTPDNPRIIQLAAPKIMTLEGESASIAIGSTRPIQYMERNPEGLFQLNSLETDNVGLHLSLKPAKADKDGVLTCELSFKYSWVKERETLEGVNLEVGRPMLGNVATEGTVQMRVGEWSCYQTPVDSEGWIFLFLRAEERPAGVGAESNKAISPMKESRKNANQTKADEAAETETQSKGPKVQVGGSVEVRVGAMK